LQRQITFAPKPTAAIRTPRCAANYRGLGPQRIDGEFSGAGEITGSSK
jgi:hypothetical protein